MSERLTEVTFTSAEARRTIIHPEVGTTPFPVDLVTAIEGAGRRPAKFGRETWFSKADLDNPRQLTAVMQSSVASRLFDFCIEHYVEEDSPPAEKKFDCFSSVTYWLGRTATVDLGVGTSKFQLNNLDMRPSELRPQPRTAYAAYTEVGSVTHALLGLGPDPQRLGRDSLHVYGVNGELILGPAYAIAGAYAGSGGNVVELVTPEE
jgi:hypothetical protein